MFNHKKRRELGIFLVISSLFFLIIILVSFNVLADVCPGTNCQGVGVCLDFMEPGGSNVCCGEPDLICPEDYGADCSTPEGCEDPDCRDCNHPADTDQNCNVSNDEMTYYVVAALPDRPQDRDPITQNQALCAVRVWGISRLFNYPENWQEEDVCQNAYP